MIPGCIHVLKSRIPCHQATHLLYSSWNHVISFANNLDDDDDDKDMDMPHVAICILQAIATSKMLFQHHWSILILATMLHHSWTP